MAICMKPSPSSPALERHVLNPTHGLGKLLLRCLQLFLQPGSCLLHGLFSVFLDAPEFKQKPNGQCETQSEQKQNPRHPWKPQSPKSPTSWQKQSLNLRNKPLNGNTVLDPIINQNLTLRLRPSPCLLRLPGLWPPPWRLTPGLCLPDTFFIAMALGAILRSKAPLAREL